MLEKLFYSLFQEVYKLYLVSRLKKRIREIIKPNILFPKARKKNAADWLTPACFSNGVAVYVLI